jgi:hypothetical protein
MVVLHTEQMRNPQKILSGKHEGVYFGNLLADGR